jgi:hypothetical protein
VRRQTTTKGQSVEHSKGQRCQEENVQEAIKGQTTQESLGEREKKRERKYKYK